jgi:hypothetical protein
VEGAGAADGGLSSATSQLRMYAMATTVRNPVFKGKIERWIDYRLPNFTFMHHQLNEYPTPKNLNYLWISMELRFAGGHHAGDHDPDRHHAGNALYPGCRCGVR